MSVKRTIKSFGVFFSSSYDIHCRKSDLISMDVIPLEIQRSVSSETERSVIEPQRIQTKSCLQDTKVIHRELLRRNKSLDLLRFAKDTPSFETLSQVARYS